MPIEKEAEIAARAGAPFNRKWFSGSARPTVFPRWCLCRNEIGRGRLYRGRGVLARRVSREFYRLFSGKTATRITRLLCLVREFQRRFWVTGKQRRGLIVRFQLNTECLKLSSGRIFDDRLTSRRLIGCIIKIVIIGYIIILLCNARSWSPSKLK